MQLIPEASRKVIVFDDFAKETRKIYQELAFLGVADDAYPIPTRQLF